VLQNDDDDINKFQRVRSYKSLCTTDLSYNVQPYHKYTDNPYAGNNDLNSLLSKSSAQDPKSTS
jgi:hypothetical protein